MTQGTEVARGDSCQETVKLAFPPRHFPLRRVSREETVSFDPLCLTLAPVSLHTAHLFNTNLTLRTIWLVRTSGCWVSISAVAVNGRYKANCEYKCYASLYRIHSHSSVWKKPQPSFGNPTRRLEVETSELHRISGMVQRHFLIVGEAAFPRFRFCPFSAEQTARTDY